MQRGKNKIQRKWFRSCIVMSGSCLFMMVVFYIFSINALATKGYEMRSIENTLSELSETHKQMRIEEAQLTSLYRIRQVSAELLLDSAEDIYIIHDVGQFAMKN